MNLYEYNLIIDDIVLDTGYIHASSEVEFEARFKKEVYPKRMFNWMNYKKMYCEDCNDDLDVSRYHIHQKAFIKCYFCRGKHVSGFVSDVNQRYLKFVRDN